MRWSIPACAGEPCSSGNRTAMNTVYPRVCGGTGVANSIQPPIWGLSPRVRGNLSRTKASASGGGSIPACAGEPGKETRRVCCPEVYPRVCGGTHPVQRWATRCRGLSPRVRGNPLRRALSAAFWRSIPACAGEPRRRGAERPTGEVYPRVCGGTVTLRGDDSPDCGLSPRVRGNHMPRQSGQWSTRSIPACAGEPLTHTL